MPVECSTDQKHKQPPPRLSFDDKLAAHRSNRLSETFGQVNTTYESQSNSEKEFENETLVQLQCKTPANASNNNSQSLTSTFLTG